MILGLVMQPIVMMLITTPILLPAMVAIGSMAVMTKIKEDYGQDISRKDLE